MARRLRASVKGLLPATAGVTIGVGVLVFVMGVTNPAVSPERALLVALAVLGIMATGFLVALAIVASGVLTVEDGLLTLRRPFLRREARVSARTRVVRYPAIRRSRTAQWVVFDDRGAPLLRLSAMLWTEPGLTGLLHGTGARIIGTATAEHGLSAIDAMTTAEIERLSDGEAEAILTRTPPGVPAYPEPERGSLARYLADHPLRAAAWATLIGLALGLVIVVIVATGTAIWPRA